MICGFINKDYSIKYKELNNLQMQELFIKDMYFSINSHDEYYVFLRKGIYTAENLDKIMPLLAELNKKLFLKSKKDK